MAIIPPEERLTAPEKAEIPRNPWTVVARNRRVNKGWEELIDKFPENASRCYRDLCTAPMVRQPGRVFPLKHKEYKGAWEYEVSSGDRVFYVPHESLRKVVVYYAGKHIKPAPTPPK